MTGVGNVGLHGPPPPGAYRPFPSYASWNTGFFDASVFARSVARLVRKRESSSEAALRAAVERATRAAAVDTGAIEGLYQVDRGFTRTVATQAATWEAAVSAKGEHVRRAINDALAGYEFVLDAATHSRPITETWVRELHQTICASQDNYTVYTPAGPQQRPLPKGKYKNIPNNPTSGSTGRVHHYASVLDTGSEMARLLDELRTKSFLRAHPVLQAAYSHYAYVCVHPFADGNGRVARALASVFLYREPGIPLVIFADQRDRYLDALEAADAENPKLFINFIELCAVDTIELVCASVHPAQDTARSLSSLEQLYASATTDVELEDAALRLSNLLSKDFEEHIAHLNLPEWVSCSIVAVDSKIARPDGYRPSMQVASFSMFLRSRPPAKADLILSVATFIRTDSRGTDLLVAFDSDEDTLAVDLREIEPAVTETLRLKTSGWVEGRIASGMARLAEAAARGAEAG